MFLIRHHTGSFVHFMHGGVLTLSEKEAGMYAHLETAQAVRREHIALRSADGGVQEVARDYRIIER